MNRHCLVYPKPWKSVTEKWIRSSFDATATIDYNIVVDYSEDKKGFTQLEAAGSLDIPNAYML